MRKWHKYSKVLKNAARENNTTYGNYKMPDEYINKHYRQHPRIGFYDEYLKNNLNRDQAILSVGSGRGINELVLLKNGFNIAASDKDMSQAKETPELFSELKFYEYDTSTGPFNGRFDAIISLSVFYNFDKETLVKVISNIYFSLNPRGELIIDMGGAADNFLTMFIDKLCKYEAMFFVGIAKLCGNNNYAVLKENNGYRYKDREIIDCARKCGFKLKKRKTYDCFTEIGTRSVILRKLNARVPLLNSFSRIIGSYAPYVRIFHFFKEQI